MTGDNYREVTVADNEFDASDVELDLGALGDENVDETDVDLSLEALQDDEPSDAELSAADIFGADAVAEARDEDASAPASEEEAPAPSDAEEQPAPAGADSPVTVPSAPARGLDDDFEINLDFDSGQEEGSEEPAPMDFDAEKAVNDAMAELRAELDEKFGDWYVVHTYAGMENRVKQNVEQRVTSLNMEDYIYETVVPTETVVEMKNGNKKEVTRVYLPGYVLVRMDLTDESWSCIRHTPAVTGFVGNANEPTPLMIDEVENMLRPGVVARVTAQSQGKGKRPPKKIEVQDYQIGDAITVIEGPFAGVPGTITEINPNTQRLIATVEFMGRDTPVDLTFPQIERAV